MGADIINMSLGTNEWVDGLYRMAGYANSQNIFIVASAGNDPAQGVLAPANYSWKPLTLGKTLAIGSVNSNDYLSSFSAYGNALTATAPGENVLAAFPNNEMGTATGTSFAAPQASGALALAMSELSNANDIHSLGTELWQSLDFGSYYKNLAKSRNTARLDIDKLVRNLPGWSEPSYNLVSVNSDKCLDVYQDHAGASVRQWECIDGHVNQKWDIEPVGDYYRLISKRSGKMLDVASASTDNHANVFQWDRNSSNSQLWELRPASEGYQLVAKHSGKCADVSGVSKDNGANVHQWGCHGGTNQQWQIEVSR